MDNNDLSMLQSAFDTFDSYPEAVLDSTRSRTLIQSADKIWPKFTGIMAANIFIRNFSKSRLGKKGPSRSWIPEALLSILVSPTGYLRGIMYTNGLIVFDPSQSVLEDEWTTFCHPMHEQEFHLKMGQ